MALFQISTTGVTPVTIEDLGNRSFTHPATVDFDLSDEYTIEEIRDSADLKAKIVAGDLTAKIEGTAVTDAASWDKFVEDFKAPLIEQNATDIASLQADVAQIQNGGRRLSAVINVVDATAVPPTEVSGDRYWLDFSGAPNAAWDGASQGDIVEFDGASWVYAGAGSAMEEGDVAYSDGSNTDWVYIDDGGAALEERTGLLQQTADQVPYTPGDNADWDVVPDDVAEGIDELAQRVDDLEGGGAAKKMWTWTCGDDGNVNGTKALQRAGGSRLNLAPFRTPYTGTIHAISVQSRDGDNETYNIQVLVNDVVQLTSNIVAADGIQTTGLAVSLTAGDKVEVNFVKLSDNIRDLGVELFCIEA